MTYAEAAEGNTDIKNRSLLHFTAIDNVLCIIARIAIIENSELELRRVMYTVTLISARRHRRCCATRCKRGIELSFVFTVLTQFLLCYTQSFSPLHINDNTIRIGRTKNKQQQYRSNVVITATKKFRKSLPSNRITDANVTATTKKKSKFYLPRKVVRIYTDYAKRLWKETNPEARKFVDSHRVAKSILLVQQLLLQGEQDKKALSMSSNPMMVVSAATSSHAATTSIPEPQRQQLLDACAAALLSIGIATSTTDATQQTQLQNDSILIPNGEQLQINGSIPPSSLSSSLAVENDDSEALTVVDVGQEEIATTSKPAKTRRSIGFGAAMGLVVTCWVFSGSYIFTGLFTLMTALGQLEYYRMVMNTGIFPARRISVIGACSMFLAALFTPDLHQIVLPISGLWAMVWFLTMRRTLTPIPEIATTFTGLFYLGYVPSFWVRIRLIGMGREPTRLAPITGPMLKFLEAQGKTLPSFIPQAIHLPITTGAIFIFWTWLCLAFSDVGAYFVGRTFGKTKLGSVFPAAGATSPNKTIEGVVGGCAVSAVLAIIGAWVQRWPYPIITGALHGLFLGLLGLLGDLTASMLKRDAGLKDFGDLLPEHGGIMDRVDSFIWTAPYSWLVCAYVIPALKQMCR